MRLFLDANVLFSAAYRETGSVRAFFALAEAGLCALVSSPFAVEEARRNVDRKHPSRLGDLERLVQAIELCAEPGAAALAVAAGEGLPGKDSPILAAAIEARCHVLVTGDRTHFKNLFGRRIHGTVVMLPVDALEVLVG